MTRHYYLTPVLGGPGAPRYAVTNSAQLIGRSEQADIALLEPTVSREHARIRADADVVLIDDLGSKHGTFVNSKRVNNAELKLGDIVVFGLSLVLRLEASEAPITAESERENVNRATTISQVQVPVSQDPHELPTAHTNSATSQQRHTIGAQSVPASNRSTPVNDHAIRLRKLAASGAVVCGLLPRWHRDLQAIADRLTDPAARSGASDIIDQIASAIDRAGFRTPPLHSVDLLDIGKQAVRQITPYAAQAKVRINLAVPANLFAFSDTRTLQPTIINLLRSAVDAAPARTLITFSATQTDQRVALRMTHNGELAAPEIIRRAFDPLVTHTDDWSSLAFSLFEARFAIARIGGELMINSDQSKTTLDVWLPIRKIE